MANLYDLAAQFRRDLLAGETRSANALIIAYGAVYQRLQADAKALLDELAAEDANRSRLYRRQRIADLKQQVLSEIHTFAAFAETAVAQCQRDAVYQAGDNARQLSFAGMQPSGIVPQWNYLPAQAVQHLIGTLQDGSPLRDLLNTIAPQVADGIAETLTTGLALGHSPRRVAREVRQAAGIGLTRALTISRTETLRSYRAASIANYQANSDVVTGWQWVATRSRRTCAMCLAMDGKVFPLDTPFGSHPCCRCCPVPQTKSFEELGSDAPENGAERQTGAEWLAGQSAEVQEHVLGPGKYALYREGKLELSDLVEYRDDPQWGPTRTEKPLKDITG